MAFRPKQFGRRFKLGLESNVNGTGYFDHVLEHLRPTLNAIVICFSHSWGGLEQVAAQDALDAVALGLKVRMMCLEKSPIHEYLKGKAHIEILPLQFTPRNHFDLRLRRELHTWIDQGVNLIHTHQPSLLGSIVPWLWRRPRVALLATRHIMNNHSKKDFFHRALYSRLDWLIVMSHTLKENVMSTHSIREKCLKVVNLGLDFNVFNPKQVDAQKQRVLWGADSDTIVIGLVGRIDPAKGQATFIRAAAGLLKNSPNLDKKLKFVIVGEETLGSSQQHLSELKQMLKQFKLDEHVVFTGYQQNIPEIMRSFDIFVMPSRQEAFGLVAIEAMAMECPIVISQGGSAAEIVGEQEFGLMVKPEDAFDLQRQLRHLLDHPEIRTEMGRKARTHVHAHYDKQKRLIKSLILYERALKRRGILSHPLASKRSTPKT